MIHVHFHLPHIQSIANLNIICLTVHPSLKYRKNHNHTVLRVYNNQTK